MKTKVIIISVLSIVIYSHCTAITLKVIDGAYPTIQAAIDDANDGDVVRVYPGLYLENINFSGKNITVTSTGPENPSIVAGTIIDANGQGSAVTFNSGETRDAVLTGFTITGGTGTYVVTAADTNMYFGAGIYCDYSSPTIVGNVITENHGLVVMDGNNVIEACYGGGIASVGGEPLITRNTIKYNDAYVGAGVMVNSGEAEIKSNLIYGNYAVYGGGATPMFGGKVLANTITENFADIGGGVCLLYDEVIGKGLAKSNIICNNTQGSGVYIDSNYFSPITPWSQRWSIFCSDFVFNDLFNNHPNDYFEAISAIGFTYNIPFDPLFINPAEFDFRLKSTSPCIDAGDPNYVPGPEETDFANLPRVHDGRIDIGAHEYPGALQAKLYFVPRVLNMQSRRRTIIALLAMPQGVLRSDIDQSERIVLNPGNIQARRQFAFQMQKYGRPFTWVMAVFYNSDCVPYLSSGQNQVEVTGKLNDGRDFIAVGKLYVISPVTTSLRR